MSVSRALSASVIALLTTLVLAGGVLAKGEEPTAAVAITPGGPDQPTVVDVELMAGEEPFPVDPSAAILIRAVHRETGEVVEEVAASTDDVGAYTANLNLSEPGAWRIAVRGRYGSDTWTFRTATGAEWTQVTLADVAAAGALGAAEAAGEQAPSSGSEGPSPLLGIAALLTAGLLVAIWVAGSLRRRSATTAA